MSFWNKNKLPAEYRDKTEDEIAALLTAGATAQAEATTSKTVAEAAEAAKVKAEKDAADARAALKLAQEAAVAGGGEEPIERREAPKGPPTEADWLTNPNEAFQRSIAPLAAVAMHGSIMAAKAEAERFIQQQSPLERRLWNKYITEITNGVNSLSPEQKILPQTWINQFTFVKGIHLADVAKEAQGGGDTFFAETASSTGGGLPSGNEKNDDKLTPEEEKIAKRLGRTPEQYLAQKKKMQFGPALQ